MNAKKAMSLLEEMRTFYVTEYNNAEPLSSEEKIALDYLNALAAAVAELHNAIKREENAARKAAIEHFEYGISHDIFEEPVRTHAQLAVKALKQQGANDD